MACGLRQGCPLSTTLLFNLVSSGTCPSACARCALARAWPLAPRPSAAALHLPKSLTWDTLTTDAGLCGQTLEELQQLIDCYCDYCGENGLLVNPAKCEAMVFGTGRYPLQIQWLARTLRYWNKLAGLSPRSLLGGTFVANVAAGLGCQVRPHQRVGGRAARCPAVCVPRPWLDGALDAGQAD